MKIEIHHRCDDFDSYRAARVKSLFNVDTGANVEISAELPIETGGWSIGLVVGPSGSGKTSIGREIFGPGAFYEPAGWPADAPVIDAIAPGGSFDDVTAALAAVGLGSVPAWLRPYHVLSNGERFRADLAKIVSERPARVVIDEFTSVVDRQIARIGAHAFSKAWRRTGGQVVLLSCHRDIIDWVDPDWIHDPATGQFSGRYLRRRPSIELDIYETDWRFWPAFEAHHYLKLPRPIAASAYIASLDGEPVAHLAFSPRPGLSEARACRFVVLPEWQGLGIGGRFLDAVAAMWRRGENRYDRPMPTLINTSHPGLAARLRRHPMWAQVSATLYGARKTKSRRTIQMSQRGAAGYGGHFRASQGFRYIEGAEIRGGETVAI
jgi:GNAT superfamily N-acetyltransferase